MFKLIKNKTKGFTMVEVVIALGILVILSGFALTSISSISQTRMKQFAQTIKSEFELTKKMAQTYGGGSSSFTLVDTEDGLIVRRTFVPGIGSSTIEEKALDDPKLTLTYKRTGERPELQLGDVLDDGTTVSELQFSFAQSTGEILGPDLIDYIIISNGNKSYKLIIKQSTGMMYYDYEIKGMNIGENIAPESADQKVVQIPSFAKPVDGTGILVMRRTGATIQPDVIYDAENIKVSGMFRAINATDEPYEIVFTLKDPNAQWADNTRDPIVLQWKITD